MSTLNIFIGSALNPAGGAWVSLKDFTTQDEIFAHVAEICPAWAIDVQYNADTCTCGGDYEVSDTEGIPSSVGTSLSEILAFAEAFNRSELSHIDETDRAEIMDFAMDQTSSRDWDDIISEIEDHLVTQSLSDYASEIVDTYGLPEFALNYFDYEKFEQDLGFEITEIAYGYIWI